MTKDSILGRWGKSLLEAGNRCGKDFRIDTQARGWLNTGGFEDVVEFTHKLPIGPWSECSRLQEIGRWNLAWWKEGVEGWSLALLTGALKVSPRPCVRPQKADFDSVVVLRGRANLPRGHARGTGGFHYPRLSVHVGLLSLSRSNCPAADEILKAYSVRTEAGREWTVEKI